MCIGVPTMLPDIMASGLQNPRSVILARFCLSSYVHRQTNTQVIRPTALFDWQSVGSWDMPPALVEAIDLDEESVYTQSFSLIGVTLFSSWCLQECVCKLAPLPLAMTGIYLPLVLLIWSHVNMRVKGGLLIYNNKEINHQQIQLQTGKHHIHSHCFCVSGVYAL